MGLLNGEVSRLLSLANSSTQISDFLAKWCVMKPKNGGLPAILLAILMLVACTPAEPGDQETSTPDNSSTVSRPVAENRDERAVFAALLRIDTCALLKSAASVLPGRWDTCDLLRAARGDENGNYRRDQVTVLDDCAEDKAAASLYFDYGTPGVDTDHVKGDQVVPRRLMRVTGTGSTGTATRPVPSVSVLAGWCPGV